jgi:hypothetical protein
MEELASQLSTDTSTVTIIYTPKYHCEIACEGIEYSWGLSKKYYRNLPLVRKKGLVNVRSSVLECVNKVTIDSVRKFAALARRYMLAYMFYDADHEGAELRTKLSFESIERFVKRDKKTHRSVPDLDMGNASKVWKESLCLP